MKSAIDFLLNSQDYGVVIVGALFVMAGVLMRTLYNFMRGIKSKDKPAQWWSKKAFAFLLGCILMRFLSGIAAIENDTWLLIFGYVFGFFPDVAIHYLFSAKRTVKSRNPFKDRPSNN